MTKAQQIVNIICSKLNQIKGVTAKCFLKTAIYDDNNLLKISIEIIINGNVLLEIEIFVNSNNTADIHLSNLSGLCEIDLMEKIIQALKDILTQVIAILNNKTQGS